MRTFTFFFLTLFTLPCFGQTRHELVQPVLETLNSPFTLLDIGSAGDVSSNITKSFPESTYVMINGPKCTDLTPQVNTPLYSTICLNDTLDIDAMEFLSDTEHFDVVLCLLASDHMPDYKNDAFDETKQFIDNVLTLGNHVIIEIAQEANVNIPKYIEELRSTMECTYLGSVKRSSEHDYVGFLYWFQNKPEKTVLSGINYMTFQHFNGTVPSADEIELVGNRVQGCTPPPIEPEEVIEPEPEEFFELLFGDN